MRKKKYILIGVFVTLIIKNIIGLIKSKEKKEENSIKTYNRINGYYYVLCMWIRNLNSGKTIEQYCVHNKIKTLGIYGIGFLSDLLVDELKDTNVNSDILIERNARKKSYQNQQVIKLENINDFHLDAIIVTPVFAFNDIKKEINCFSDIRVISLYDIVNEIHDY